MLLNRIGVFGLFFVSFVALGSEKYVPTLEETFLLKTIGAVEISPDGSRIAYIKQELDFEEDQYLNQLWVYDIKAETHRQLTFGEKSAGSIAWSSDSKWVLFKRDGKLMAMRCYSRNKMWKGERRAMIFHSSAFNGKLL